VGPFQYVFLLNPLVFMSEAMRVAVTPNVPHMSMGLLLFGLVGCVLGFGWIGARTFERRTIL
jgi:ABC-2 type transport system permease protein